MTDFLVILLLLGIVVFVVGTILIFVDLIRNHNHKVSLTVIISGLVLTIVGFGGLYIQTVHQENTPLVLSTKKKSYWINDDANSIIIPVKVTKGAEISGYDDGGTDWKLKNRTTNSNLVKLRVKDYGARLDIKLKETLGDRTKHLTFSVYPAAAEKKVSTDIYDSQEIDEQENSSSEVYKFGQSGLLSQGSNIASVQVISAQQADGNNVAVTDLYHNNDEGATQFVIVTYKVTAVKGDFSLDSFDGSEFSFADQDGETSTISSNRDNTADELHEGESSTLRIGIGLIHSSKELAVHFNNATWKGSIN